MESKNIEEERYYRARKRMEEIKGFYMNLRSFIMVNFLLIAINLITSPHHLWFYWPLLWWGIGLVYHGIKVFNYMPFFSKDWEERKIKKFMEKDEQKKHTWE
ncbi:2TM domain-containing protein [Flavobacterium sp. A45]|uniref:2TM domain-containing protein n=1 Tax=Flavobacterium sp. A45 TaxID=1945862 RepID=UPI000986D06D|nr:2TM domain-containing protein [Flavobacterium sp. A45]OOG65807.1 histidine kinase [Flavobacterium sp. A45]